jgi:hypothetical protein
MLMIPKHAVLIHRQLNQSVELSHFIEDFLYIDTSLMLLALLSGSCVFLSNTKAARLFKLSFLCHLDCNIHCCIHLCARSFSQDVKSLSNSKSGNFTAALRVTQSCLY